MNAIQRLWDRIKAAFDEFSAELAAPPASEERAVEEVDSWSGDASGYADTAAYCAACLVDVNAAAGRTEKAQSHCMLPVRRPGSSKDADKAVMAAAGGHGIGAAKKPADVSDDDWKTALTKAANRIIADYGAMDKVAPNAIYEIAGKTAPERAISIQDVASQIMAQLYGTGDGPVSGETPWLSDIYLDNGQPVAVLAKGGKLYRAPIAIDGNQATLGAMAEIEVQFSPVRSVNVSVVRMADGRYRWFAIAETAVLNRMAEIDSRALFTDFLRQFHPGDVRLDFYHDSRIAFGSADWLAVEDAVLLASGPLDAEHPVGRAYIDAKEQGRGEWGCSVAFTPSTPPEMAEVAAGVTIPVYTAGVLRAITILPESRAASWYTTTAEVSRMRKEVQDALKELFGDEAAAQRFIETVDQTNREIAEQNLVTREGEPPTAEAAPVAAAPVAAALTETPAAQEPPAEAREAAPAVTEPAAPPPLVLDDSAVAAIVAQLKAALPDQAPMAAALEDLGKRIGVIEAAHREATAQADSRLKALEQADDAKRREWQADRPARQAQVVTYRPREAAAQSPAASTPPQEEPSSTAQANAVIAKVKQTLKRPVG